MKYIRQFGIILFVSFLGEACKTWIPLPIPASIYGLIFMLIALETKLIPLDQVKECGNYLIQIMPIMFIPAAVGLMVSYQALQSTWIAILVITVITTILVMAVTGVVTQHFIRLEKRKQK